MFWLALESLESVFARVVGCILGLNLHVFSFDMCSIYQI